MPSRCPAVYVLIDGRTWHQGIAAFERHVKALIDGGVEWIQFRDKSLTDRQHIEIGQLLTQWTRQTPAVWIMNDRVDLAIVVDADGVHLGQDDMPFAMARELMGPQKIIGVSTHSMEQVEGAVAAGADYIGVGPVFQSQTKQFSAFVGVELVKSVAQSVSVPAFAIGGITLENVGEIRHAGLRRVAVAGVVGDSDSPGKVVNELLSLLR
jgi:thiamine-phosphate pyrophosphorylase